MSNALTPSHCLDLPATLEQWPAVAAFLEAAMDTLQLPPRLHLQVTMAAEEIFVNIANYAYGGQPGPARVTWEVEPEQQFHISFIDHGIAYDPLAHHDPDINAAAADRQIGGLGIFMAKKLMDRLEYHRRDETNQLEMWKQIPRA